MKNVSPKLHPDLAAAPGWDFDEDGRISQQQADEMAAALNCAPFFSLIARLGTTVKTDSARAEYSGELSLVHEAAPAEVRLTKAS